MTSLNFNFIRDIAPVVGLVRGPLVMGVNPAVPATTVLELIAYARASPDEINIARPATEPRATWQRNSSNC